MMDNSSTLFLNENSTASEDEPRDELRLVRKLTQKETRRIRFVRICLLSILSTAAVVVTWTTYTLMRREQTKNYATAFSRFSQTLTTAALEGQRKINDVFVSFSASISGAAQAANATWPYFNLPSFEIYGGEYRSQSNIEFLNINMIVSSDQREKWIEFSNNTHEEMMEESHMLAHGGLHRLDKTAWTPYPFAITPNGKLEDNTSDTYFAIWSYSPPLPNYFLLNWNFKTHPDYEAITRCVLRAKNETCVTSVEPYTVPVFTKEEHEAMHSKLANSSVDYPHSFFFHPIHEDVADHNSKIVAVLAGGVAWDAALIGLLPQDVVGINVVVKNNCNQSYTYEIRGPDAIFVGNGDRHDPAFDHMEENVDLSIYSSPDFPTIPDHCMYTMSLYPNSKFVKLYHNELPSLYASLVGTTFVVMITIFFVYEVFINKRNDIISENAAQSNGIVNSMFPEEIRDRLLEKRSIQLETRTILSPAEDIANGDALADLFLDTTIIFADVTNFTAWSSVRSPSQVFQLLETIFVSFDEAAKRLKVFKIESTGDCYVAATGIPKPQKNHAVIAAMFALDIMSKMKRLTNELETSLGPDTGDLSIRIGIHSGPVTGGVMRGDRSRFQLFGDTMNTASRLETTGKVGCIQVSKETANLLELAGKRKWLVPREDKVLAKGKGDLQTFWLVRRASSSVGSETDYSCDEADSKADRLIGWNVAVLLRLLKQVVASRTDSNQDMTSSRHSPEYVYALSSHSSTETPLDEVREIIHLPDFDRQKSRAITKEVEINSIVAAQLYQYVEEIARRYRSNAFHNFEHASHVIMSVIKLMSRIVASVDFTSEEIPWSDDQDLAFRLNDHTCGITSDPLTQLACVWSALIHDVDHSGVPNQTVLVENPQLAERYNHRSVAEQNSLDLSWNLMMEDRFTDLRKTMFSTNDEQNRFRQLLVNSVMATDLGDKELKELRNGRWQRAFQDADSSEDYKDSVNRKATIVIEHIIQASDVSHTMQHWHIYQKWNHRLFQEMHQAFVDGRSDEDPSTFWYKGEIGFFDFYIIPLAKKLKDCGVFGKSSDEFLDYATKNREEWVARGEEITNELRVKAERGQLTYQFAQGGKGGKIQSSKAA